MTKTKSTIPQKPTSLLDRWKRLEEIAKELGCPEISNLETKGLFQLGAGQGMKLARHIVTDEEGGWRSDQVLHYAVSQFLSVKASRDPKYHARDPLKIAGMLVDFIDACPSTPPEIVDNSDLKAMTRPALLRYQVAIYKRISFLERDWKRWDEEEDELAVLRQEYQRVSEFNRATGFSVVPITDEEIREQDASGCTKQDMERRHNECWERWLRDAKPRPEQALPVRENPGLGPEQAAKVLASVLEDAYRP